MNSLTYFWLRIPKPFELCKHSFSSFSVLFTITKAITSFEPAVKFNGTAPLAILTLISIVLGVKQSWKPHKIKLKIPYSDTAIEILFGDIFHQKGLRVIPTNEFFDSEIGLLVSDKSLHGTFLKQCFGGHQEAFDKQVESQLQTISHKETKRKNGKTKSYPLGTNALITSNKDRYIVFALSHTDTETNKAFSDAEKMSQALAKVWERARNESNGHELNLPLVGSGLSGVGLPTRDLLNLIILSAITATKSKKITETIRIVLHKTRFAEIDLRNVKKYWETK
jgi:hypothetical protein